MAHRYWKACWSMGYAGTDAEEEIDLVDYFGYTEEGLHPGAVRAYKELGIAVAR